MSHNCVGVSDIIVIRVGYGRVATPQDFVPNLFLIETTLHDCFL